MHGMGDSCFNRGMESITEESGAYLNVYSTCIPTGDTRGEDTMNGFFMSMDDSVDVMAEKVRADPNLAHGFHCVGLSQGNNLCRGYIQQYNDPVVHTHLSIHGPVVGVAALPRCGNNKGGGLCESISDMLSKLAYTERLQDGLFQAGYFRDVNFLSNDSYLKWSEIGRWNNEGEAGVSQDIKANFAKTSAFAMVQALGDTVVVPREGEWFGAYADGDYSTLLVMNETTWYKEDTFGLRSADEAGKIHFESTEGNHLDFTDDELYTWLDKYCT